MRDFITDRTQADVDRCSELLKKGYTNFTEDERTEWIGVAMRGAYNYTDFNRVESAVKEAAVPFMIDLETKTDWGCFDAPTMSETRRYLSNISAIRERCPDSIVFPSLPNNLNNMNYTIANNIEITMSLALRYTDSVSRSGDLFCGEV